MPKLDTRLRISQVAAANPAALVYSGTFFSVSVKAMPDNAATVYVGTSSSVNTTTGYPLAAGEILNIDLQASGSLYAYCATAGNEIAYVGGI